MAKERTTLLLSNICYTLNNVLSSAYSEINFNEQDFETAKNWCLYCEKIYENSFNKPGEERLNSYIKELVPRIKHCLIPNADFHFLKYTTKALLLLFLQNSSINMEDYGTLLERYSIYGLEIDDLEMPLHIIKGANSLLDALSIGGSNSFSYNQWLLLGSGLLLHNLLKRMTNETDSRNSEICLRNNLDTLKRNKTRLMFLLIATKEKTLNLSQPICAKLQNYIMNWLVQEMANAHNARSASLTFLEVVINQPPSLLLDMSLKSPEFLQEYFKALILHGQKLEPHYLTDGYSWKCISNAVQFAFLTDHFSCLLIDDSNIRVITRHILHELSQTKGGSLWDDILNECLIRMEWI